MMFQKDDMMHIMQEDYRNGEQCIDTFRFKFTDEFMQDMFAFSKIHQYDDRKSFKEAWTKWAQEHDEDICRETTRIEQLGYRGDIKDKMFKSARYYFRKKSVTHVANAETVARKQYVSINKDLLVVMDTHIHQEVLAKHNKPHAGFLEFCETNIEMLKETVKKLHASGVTEPKDIQNKIKKTYKNRYSMIALTLQKNRRMHSDREARHIEDL